MCKKIGIAAVAVIAGLFVLNHTKLGDWAKYACHQMKEKIQSQVPPEVQIERLKYELTQLEPEINKSKDQLARQIVEVRRLKGEIKTSEDDLEKKYDEIVAAKKEVDGATKTVAYKGRSLSPKKAKELIVRDFEAYKSAKKAVDMKRNLVAAKEAGIEEATRQLNDWNSTRDGLKAQIEELEAELQTIKLAEARHDINIDNTRLNRLKDSIKELRQENEVRMERLRLEGDAVASTSDKPEKAESVDRAWNEIGEEKPAKVADSK
jgi:chromosome segregation ATPase